MASSENLSPQTIANLARELKRLAQKPPEGIRFIPNEGSMAQIEAELEGPVDTPYHGGFFRVKLVLAGDYPNAPPKGYFLTKIFHPNVSAAGDICVNTLKKDWKPDLGITHVLQVVRCLLIVPFPESSLNDEAGKLFMENYEDYAKHARLMTSIHASKRCCAPTGEEEAAGGEAGAVAAAAGGESLFGDVGASSAKAKKVKSAKGLTSKQKEKKKKGLKRL